MDGGRRSFRVKAVTIAPGGERPYDATEWCDAIVSVQRGELELECMSGARRRFGRGSLIWLCDLPLRALHSTGPDSVRLVAVSRGDAFAAPRVSLRLDTRSSPKEAHAMTGTHGGDEAAWVPYVQVDDLHDAHTRAAELGATVLQEPTEGPAGRYSWIRDTGGAPLALFQPSA